MLNNSTQQVKKDYRVKQHPTFEEMEDVKARLYDFTTQTKTANLFNTSTPNIAAAFKGKNTHLFNKIKSYVEKHELRLAEVSSEQ